MVEIEEEVSLKEGNRIKELILDHAILIESPSDLRTVEMLTAPWTEGKVMWMRRLVKRNFKTFESETQ